MVRELKESNASTEIQIPGNPKQIAKDIKKCIANAATGFLAKFEDVPFSCQRRSF